LQLAATGLLVDGYLPKTNNPTVNKSPAYQNRQAITDKPCAKMSLFEVCPNGKPIINENSWATKTFEKICTSDYWSIKCKYQKS
jgi:hypothetical protein